MRHLSARDGTPTNAVYGFLMILSRLLDESRPDALCVCFDVHAPTFRHEKYAEYKAGRRPMPDELRPQIPLLKEVLAAMNVPAYELAGWEADDLLGTIGAKCAAAGWECEIDTGDRDSLQLVSELVHVKLVVSRGGKTETKEFSPESFYEAYGFAPANIVDLKALMGDASDNIKGVPGVGEKTAGELIRRFGTIAAIYEKLDALDIAPSLKKKLEAGRKSAAFSKGWTFLSSSKSGSSLPRKNPAAAPCRFFPRERRKRPQARRRGAARKTPLASLPRNSFPAAKRRSASACFSTRGRKILFRKFPSSRERSRRRFPLRILPQRNIAPFSKNFSAGTSGKPRTT